MTAPGSVKGGHPAARSGDGRVAALDKPPLDERSRRVAESLSVGNPGNNARNLPAQASPRAECQIELGIDEVRPYEHNPRRTTNAKFQDIKESIRAGGLRSPITVTQRPGETHYIVEAGGNTRLLALRQLWAETKDPRFGRLLVLYRPWRSETQVLTAHLIENEQRGDMNFWDRATGIVALKQRLEAEQGRALTLRPLEDALHGLGLAVNTATLALYLYATERLRVLGDAVPDLAGLDVKTLQPRLNALRRYAQARAGIEEAVLYGEVFEPVFRKVVAATFTVAATVEACEVALARRLGEAVVTLREAVSLRAAGGHREAGRARGLSGAGGDGLDAAAPISPRATVSITPASPSGRPSPDPEPGRVLGPEDRPAHKPAQRAATSPGPAGPFLTPSRSPFPSPFPSAVPVSPAQALSTACGALFDADEMPATPSAAIAAFARVAGLEASLEPAPGSRLGYRLQPLPPSGREDPARRRAWSALALVCDPRVAVGPGASLPATLPDLIGWLTDPGDETSAAFWTLLALLRRCAAFCPTTRATPTAPTPEETT